MLHTCKPGIDREDCHLWSESNVPFEGSCLAPAGVESIALLRGVHTCTTPMYCNPVYIDRHRWCSYCHCQFEHHHGRKSPCLWQHLHGQIASEVFDYTVILDILFFDRLIFSYPLIGGTNQVFLSESYTNTSFSPIIAITSEHAGCVVKQQFFSLTYRVIA